MIDIGSIAPDFALKDQNHEDLHLSVESPSREHPKNQGFLILDGKKLLNQILGLLIYEKEEHCCLI